jgi:DNA segregation ATPase FtsK/SpoIIIE, S-DNA-T family
MAKTGTRPRTVSASRTRGANPRGGVRTAGRKRQGPSPVSTSLARIFQVETFGLSLIVLAFLGLLWLVPFASGPLSPDYLAKAVGLHAFTLVVALGALGAVVWRRQESLLWSYPRVLAAGVLGFFVSAGVLGLWNPEWLLGETSLAEVSAGGDLGRAFSADAVGVLVWLGFGAGFVTLVWPEGVKAALRRSPDVAATIWGWRIPHRLWRALIAFVDFIFPTKPPIDERPLQTPPSWLPPEPEPIESFEVEPPLEESPPPEPLKQAPLPIAWSEDDMEAAPLGTSASAAPATAAFQWNLPPLDMLSSSAPPEEVAPPDNDLRAQLIVETLASFGVDARVVQINGGPVVTQFGIEPGWEVKYRDVQERDRDGKPLLDRDGRPKVRREEVSRTRVRVNQIVNLQNDLALALAAPSLRIEAPVPGKSVIGIEVPNTSVSVVTMRSVIETSAFQRLAVRSKLAVTLGKSVSGEPVVADLARMPHLLIAGATGSGKSVCMNSLIACILMHARPEEVRFVMIDPKRVELSSFAMIPHLAFSSIVVDVEKVVGTLGAVLHEMESRYKRFASLAVRNIEGYNKHPRVTEKMPYWVVIIDELADLMMAAPFEVERQICRLAQLARATGIHLIVATQRPSVDVVTGLIKANFPTRIAFAMSSQVDSRTILDSAGAERLLGRGDMLYMPTDASKPKRVQGVFVSDQEIDRIVGFWTQERMRTGSSTPVYDHLLEQAHAQIEDEDENDPMYERAKALAQEHSRVSTSMLQRRLRIGYPRAARLMDMLEEDGIIASSGGGGSRDVIARNEDLFDDAEDGFRPPHGF